MNPLAIIAVVVALIVGYFGFGGGENGIFGGSGPIASGPGSSEIRNPQPISSGGGFFSGGSQSRPAPPPQPKPGESPFKDLVRIISVERSGDRPEREYAVIRYGGGFFGLGQSQPNQPAVIDATGWTISSRRQSERIPAALNIPEIDASEQDIFLPPGGELIILTGTPSYQKNFRENRCAGYFNQSHSFVPSLSDSCADDTPDRSELLNRGFNGECIEAIESVPACRTPRGPFEAAIIKSECIDYMNENFSYVGCVKNFRDRRDFLKSTWRVFLGRSQKLFDPRHDRVILRDRQGLLVDEFEY